MCGSCGGENKGGEKGSNGRPIGVEVQPPVATRAERTVKSKMFYCVDLFKKKGGWSFGLSEFSIGYYFAWKLGRFGIFWSWECGRWKATVTIFNPTTGHAHRAATQTAYSLVFRTYLSQGTHKVAQQARLFRLHQTFSRKQPPT